MKAMTQWEKPKFKEIAKTFDFSKFEKILDVGGSMGIFSAEIVKNHPGVKCFSFDLKECENMSKNFIKSLKLEQKIEVISGNMFKDDFVKSDLIIMANVLHEWSLEQRKFLLQKVFSSLSNDGAFLVIEDFLENSRDKYDYALNLSCQMILNTENGYKLTKEEMENLVISAGFKTMESFKFGIICYKNHKLL